MTIKQSVLGDMKNSKNESKRMLSDHREDTPEDYLWRVRAITSKVEYWLIGFGWLISFVLGIFVSPLVGLGFYALVIFYSISASIRGLFLHIEGLIEIIAKRKL